MSFVLGHKNSTKKSVEFMQFTQSRFGKTYTE